MNEKNRQKVFDSIARTIARGGGRIEIPLAGGEVVQLPINVRESGVPTYEHPDPLQFHNGKRIKTPQGWLGKARERILEIFRREVYGRVPDVPVDCSYKQLSCSTEALDGKALRKQIRATFQRGQLATMMDVLIYLPQTALDWPVPIFLGLNFMGNHSIHPDPEITLSQKWMSDMSEEGIVDHRATPAARGARRSRWPVETILQHGFGLATVYCGDLDPDYDDGFQNGIHPLFYRQGQERPAPDEWGAISAWAWGLQRVMDYCQKDEQIDHHRVALVGHSRLGKAALWAGAQDRRFALVIANNSGCMGAALSRRCFGETIAAINHLFPHWFCERFQRYNDCEEALDVDQHMLIATIAPRPVYVASAADDLWADPRGEFLGLKRAEPVYELFGCSRLPIQKLPDVGAPVWDTLGYHIRSGGHDLTAYDWKQLLHFAGYHFGES